MIWYLSPRLTRKNQFPAVDLGVSVSRVGAKAQSPAFKDIAGNLRVTLSQFEELEEFARFGTRLDSTTRARLARGSTVRAVLRQPERQPRSALMQLIVLTGALQGLYDPLNEGQMVTLLQSAENILAMSDTQSLTDILNTAGMLRDSDKQQLLMVAKSLLTSLSSDLNLSDNNNV